MSKVVIRYEKAVCGRCAGSGEYSYNAMHGTTCYGCSGKGTTLSRTGAAAAKIIRAMRTEMTRVPVETIRPGTHIHLGGRWRRVIEVRTGDAAGHRAPDHPELIPIHIRAQGHGLGTYAGQTVQIPVTPEQWATLVAKARTLKGAEVVPA